MNYRRSFPAVVCLAALLSSIQAQEPRVKVEYPAARELKRSAHRLRMSVAQLKNAREALKDATDLARRLDPLPSQQFASLGGLWNQIDRSRTAGILELLCMDLRSCSQKADEAAPYLQCTGNAQNLLYMLSDFDPERAIQISQQWPAPPSSPSDSAEKARAQMQNQLQGRYLQQLAQREPERAFLLLEQQGTYNKLDYSLRAQLAQHLMSSGRKDEAGKLLDQAIADFGQGNPDSRMTYEYTNFVQQLVRTDPERFPQAVAALARSLNKPGLNADSGVQMRIGDQVHTLSSREASILNVFRGLSMHPELALKTLSSMPELKAKLDRLGGLDNFLNPSSTSAGSVPFSRSSFQVSPVSGPDRAMPSQPPYDPSRLLKEIKGKASKNPALVRQRLSQEVGKPEQVQVLISMAQMANHEDPDLSYLALELAGSLVGQVQPLGQRAGVLQNLIRTYRQCEGEVDPNLIKEGFVLADQLREEEKQKSQDNPNARGRVYPSDQLEIAVLAEYARDNFEAAIRYARSMPDEETKFRALIQIAQALGHMY